MEKLAILALICAMPSVAFMLVAKMNGGNKWVGNLAFKLPALISVIISVVMLLAVMGLIKV